MSTLNRKLRRELGQSKAQSLAIGLVVASGVAVFVMSVSTLAFLRETRDAYYDRYRFADVFAGVRRAPDAMAEQINEITGIATLQTRIVSEVTLDVPRLAEPAVGRLISLPDSGKPVLNAVFIKRGRLPNPERHGEVLASDAFVESNSLEIGDEIQAVLNGRLQELIIVGVALSPEYVFRFAAATCYPTIADLVFSGCQGGRWKPPSTWMVPSIMSHFDCCAGPAKTKSSNGWTICWSPTEASALTVANTRYRQDF